MRWGGHPPCNPGFKVLVLYGRVGFFFEPPTRKSLAKLAGAVPPIAIRVTTALDGQIFARPLLPCGLHFPCGAAATETPWLGC